MALANYALADFAAGRFRFPVYRRGAGPAVIVIHEIPGLHPLVVDFADRLVAQGFTVFMPSLFGTPGKPAGKGYALTSILKAMCVRRTFNMWKDGVTAPVVDWLRALAAHAHQQCGGPGVGAIGMCFTGGFALAMMTEPAVVAPVLSQPSMPVPGTGRASIDISASDLSCVRQRLAAEDLTVLGLRFKSDRMVPDERFARYRAELGDRFEAIELEDAAARPGTGISPHSVLTIHLAESGPTREAEARVVALFRQRLGLPPAAQPA